jgi:hypothetical protein
MNSDFIELLNLFNANEVKYLIVGGVAFIFHAEPRYTKDLDIWVKADDTNAAAIYKCLREFGAPLAGVVEADFANSELFYQMGRPPGRVDILMSIEGVEFDDAWSRRVEAKVEDIPVTFVSKDDLIASKLASGRPQDLNDVRVLQLPVRPPTDFQGARHQADNVAPRGDANEE